MGEAKTVTRKDASDSWLRSITNRGRETKNSQLERPKIPLQDSRILPEEYESLVVGIGPYGFRHNFALNELKTTMACQFVQDSEISIEVLYNKVAEVTSNARKFYDESSIRSFNNEELTNMLFLDGCFILQFLFSFLCKPENLEMILTEEAYSVKRDLLLLNNQLPFPVLQILMSLRFKEEGEGMKLINNFIDNVRAIRPQKISCKEVMMKFVRNCIWSPQPQNEIRSEQEIEDHQPAHLLELYHRKLINKKAIDSSQRSRIWNMYHSAKDLKLAGIRFRPSKTNAFTDVKFISTVIGGILELPQITINDSSKSLLLNLIDYERRVDGSGELWVTSYVCFLNSLIQDAEDVKVLQSQGAVLVNDLGHEQRVVDFFNMAKHLMPNPYAFNDVKRRIELHYKQIIKKCIAEWLQVHFSSPWSFLAFVAAIFGLTLAAIQTYLAAFPPKG